LPRPSPSHAAATPRSLARGEGLRLALLLRTDLGMTQAEVAEQAARVVPRMPLIKHGKFQGLASRGIFHSGFGQRGLNAIFDHNWRKLLDPGWQGATTTTGLEPKR
jgi:hypothetical protein